MSYIKDSARIQEWGTLKAASFPRPLNSLFMKFQEVCFLITRGMKGVDAMPQLPAILWEVPPEVACGGEARPGWNSS